MKYKIKVLVSKVSCMNKEKYNLILLTLLTNPEIKFIKIFEF